MWGPWIEHDGKGCPCVGQIVQIVYRNGVVEGPYAAYSRISIAGGVGDPLFDAWVHLPKDDDIVRYRVRKPRGDGGAEGHSRRSS